MVFSYFKISLMGKYLVCFLQGQSASLSEALSSFLSESPGRNSSLITSHVGRSTDGASC